MGPGVQDWHRKVRLPALVDKRGKGGRVSSSPAARKSCSLPRGSILVARGASRQPICLYTAASIPPWADTEVG